MRDDSGYLVEIANMYLSGSSLREIAGCYDKSHITIRNDLVNRLSDYNPKLYNEVRNAMEERLPDSLKKETVQNRVLRVISLYIEENLTVSQIAENIESTEFIVYRDLTIRAKNINKFVPGIFSEDDIKKIDETLENHKISNLNKR